MSVVLRCFKSVKSQIYSAGGRVVFLSSPTNPQQPRHYAERSNDSDLEFISSTILVEHGFNVQELPVVVRKLKNLSHINDGPPATNVRSSSDSNYKLIQAEFQQCLDLREVFSLLSKCTKITPNIALGAMERIYQLDKLSSPKELGSMMIQISSAKGAIIEKLLKVVMNAEDTQTILNVLNSDSQIMEPFKYKFSDEILLRASDSRLTVQQLCEFLEFLTKNKSDPRYNESIDKLWIGFVSKEADINENNISAIFKLLPEFKVSKRAILNLLEQKFSDLWNKINVGAMQDILDVFIYEKYFSLTSYSFAGRWLYLNIHALDNDDFLEIITKFTRLKYNDEHIERAIQKFMKLKSSKINSHVVVVGVLNYCMQFQLCNTHILNSCSEYYIKNSETIPVSFMKCVIYPFGFLNYRSKDAFWDAAEDALHLNFDKINADDLSSIILSFIYSGRYPLKLVHRLLSPECLVKVKSKDVLKKMHLIDTALSVECKDYVGPLLPKDHWSKPISHDWRITNVLEKTKHIFENVAGGENRMSFGVLIPYVFSDETYFIDVLFHPPGFASTVYNDKLKSSNSENIAILIHLPDHYCADNEKLVGPQMMRVKHLQLLGLKVVDLKYSIISQFYTTRNMDGFKEYLCNAINKKM